MLATAVIVTKRPRGVQPYRAAACYQAMGIADDDLESMITAVERSSEIPMARVTRCPLRTLALALTDAATAAALDAGHSVSLDAVRAASAALYGA